MSGILLEALTLSVCYHTRETSKPCSTGHSVVELTIAIHYVYNAMVDALENIIHGCFHNEAKLDTVQQKRGGLLTSILSKCGLRCAYKLQAQAGCLGVWEFQMTWDPGGLLLLPTS